MIVFYFDKEVLEKANASNESGGNKKKKKAKKNAIDIEDIIKNLEICINNLTKTSDLHIDT